MSFELSIFASHLSKKAINTKTFKSIEEFATSTLFSFNVRANKSNIPCFVRGVTTDGLKTKGCLLESSLLIIDADSGELAGKDCPAPELSVIADYLESLDYNFFAYTSFSHTEEKPKYRICVPLTEPIEEHELNLNTNMLLDVLDNAHLTRIARVREMFDWERIWYLPSWKVKNDPKHQRYYHSTGRNFEPEHLTIEEYELNEKVNKYDTKSEQQAEAENFEHTQIGWITNILKGHHPFHDSIVHLSQAMTHGGFTDDSTYLMIKNMLQASKYDPERVQQELKDLTRTIAGAHHVKGHVDISKYLTDDQLLEEYPLPPGRLGVFVQCLYDSMTRPCYEIALSAMLSNLSTIVACTHNVVHGAKTAGMSISCLTLAPTGAGKSLVSDLAKYIFRNQMDGKLNPLSDIASLLGSDDYTSFKAAANDLSAGRARHWIQAEAGETMFSQAGDKPGLMGWFLESSAQNRWNGWSMSKKMSGEYIPPVENPGITLNAVSTPHKLEKDLRTNGAIESGLLPRLLIFRINRNPPMKTEYVSSTEQFSFQPDIVEKINELIKPAVAMQSVKVEKDKINFIYTTQGQHQACVDYQEVLEKGDSIEAAFGSRSAIIVNKLAGLCTIYNHPLGSNPDALTQESLDWAYKFHSTHQRNIKKTLSAVIEANPMDAILETVRKKLVEASQKEPKLKELNQARISVARDKIKNMKAFQEMAKSQRKGTPELFNAGIKDLILLSEITVVKKNRTAPSIVEFTDLFGK